MTHDTLTNAINGLLGYSGQRIAFPNGSYYNECTAVVAQLHARLGFPLPPMWAARADGWGVQFPSELDPYYSHEAYQPGKAYPYGTLLLWNSPHIAIVLSHDGGNLVQVFQQNADPNGAPCEVFNRVVNNQFHTCTYALVPKLDQPPQEPLYRVDPIPAKQIQAKPGARKWNLAQPSFESVVNNPITTAGGTEVFTAVAVLHHREIPQYNYYLEDADTPHGWNVLDCNDYTAPPAVRTPPAPPIAAKPAEKYTLVTKVMAFPSATDAKLHQNYSESDLEPAEYYVWQTTDNTKLLGTDNMKRPNPETWVNTDDNKLPEVVPITPADVYKPTTPSRGGSELAPVGTPTVAPVVVTPVPESEVDNSWRVTHSLRSDGKPILFVATNTDTIQLYDLEGKHPELINLHPGTELEIVQWFEKDGIKYYRDVKLKDHFWYFSLKADYLTEMPQSPLDANHNGKLDIDDVPALMQGFIDYGNKTFSSLGRTVVDIAPVAKKASKQAKQVIDGFISRKKDKVS